MKEKCTELGELLRRKDWEGVFRRPTENIVIQFVRNPLAGLTAFAVDYLLLYILTEAGLHYLIAAAVAFIAGTTANYYLCRALVFNAYMPRFKNMPEYLFFIIIGVIGLGLTELFMYLITDLIGLHYLVSKIISGTLVSLWNFFARRLFIFNQYGE